MSLVVALMPPHGSGAPCRGRARSRPARAQAGSLLTPRTARSEGAGSNEPAFALVRRRVHALGGDWALAGL